MTTATRICRDKTHRGNVYREQHRAEAVARLLAKISGEDVHAYCCDVCGCWHVGRQWKWERPGLRVVG